MRGCVNFPRRELNANSIYHHIDAEVEVHVCRSMKDALAIYGEWQLRTLENHRRSVRRAGAGLRFLVVTPGPEGWGNRALVLGSALLMAMQVCVRV